MHLVLPKSHDQRRHRFSVGGLSCKFHVKAIQTNSTSATDLRLGRAVESLCEFWDIVQGPIHAKLRGRVWVRTNPLDQGLRLDVLRPDTTEGDEEKLIPAHDLRVDTSRDGQVFRTLCD